MELKPSFSLITFAYNEEEILEKQVRKWIQQLHRFSDDFEIILINDGSTDSSGDIANKLAGKFPQLRVFHHKENRGVGHALHTARRHVTKDYVFWNDIDGHFDLDDLEKVIPFLKDYDIVVAFKHNTLNTKTPFPWLKSRVNYYLIKLLFLSLIKDFQFVQFYPREFFCGGIVLESCSPFIPAECIIKAQYLGLKIKQVQIQYYSHHSRLRPSKCSDFKIIRASIRDIFSFWFRWVFLGGKEKTGQYWANKREVAHHGENNLSYSKRRY